MITDWFYSYRLVLWLLTGFAVTDWFNGHFLTHTHSLIFVDFPIITLLYWIFLLSLKLAILCRKSCFNTISSSKETQKHHLVWISIFNSHFIIPVETVWYLNINILYSSLETYELSSGMDNGILDFRSHNFCHYYRNSVFI